MTKLPTTSVTTWAAPTRNRNRPARTRASTVRPGGRRSRRGNPQAFRPPWIQIRLSRYRSTVYDPYIVKRTQIYLDTAQDEELCRRAAAEGLTKSALIRRAV